MSEPKSAAPRASRPTAPLLPTASQVPSDIVSVKQWVLWNFQWNGQKWCKVPAAPLTGKNTGHDLRHQADWTDFATARNGALQYKTDGVGFVFREGGGLTGIDFDDCLAANGQTKSVEIKKWLLRLDTYIEISPSGRGLHAICRGVPARTLTKPFEIYDQSRFFTFTAQPWYGIQKPIAERQAVLDELVAWAIAQSGAPPAPDTEPELTVESAVAYLDRVCDELAQMTDGRQLRATQVCYRLGRIMGGKPNDPRLEFQTVKKRLTEALEKTHWPREKFEVIERQLREGLDEPKPIKIIAPLVIMKAEELQRPDMPATVLCGKLGQWCRERLSEFPIAYAWPSLLAAASTRVTSKGDRCNLYVCLVGDVHTGKTQAEERASLLFRLDEEGLLLGAKYGSAEGLLEQIGDRAGMPVLWAPDELSHVLEKAQIQGASFPYILNTMFYKDRNDLTVQHRKRINCFARLSILGGVVEANFGDSFGAATTSGLYDRFLFGLFPNGNFDYIYRPMEGPPLFELRDAFGPERETLFDEATQTVVHGPRRIAPSIDRSVWDARDAIRKAEGIDSRILELAIRTALVCAAWDEKTVLHASDLGAAWELARYQQRVRVILQPNPGKNFEAMAGFKILNYLKQHANGGDWLAWRDVLRGTHVADFGPAVAERALKAMVFSGVIESAFIQPKRGPKRQVLRVPPEDQK
jgi:hypothetical protein